MGTEAAVRRLRDEPRRTLPARLTEDPGRVVNLPGGALVSQHTSPLTYNVTHQALLIRVTQPKSVQDTDFHVSSHQERITCAPLLLLLASRSWLWRRLLSPRATPSRKAPCRAWITPACRAWITPACRAWIIRTCPAWIIPICRRPIRVLPILGHSKELGARLRRKGSGTPVRSQGSADATFPTRPVALGLSLTQMAFHLSGIQV